jgi:hypothetical protein
VEGLVEKKIFSLHDLKLISNKSVIENFNINPCNLSYSHFYATRRQDARVAKKPDFSKKPGFLLPQTKKIKN